MAGRPLTRSLLAKVVLAAAIVALLAWERALVDEQSRARESSHRVGRLVGRDEREALQIAAVSVETEGRSYLYARIDGTWRCLDHHHAVASDQAVGALVNGLLEAEGVVHSDDPRRVGDYGFDTPEMWRVRLHGSELMQRPDRHVLLTVDLGRPMEGLDGVFARRPERGDVWAIDANPRSVLDAPGEAPLLDPGILPNFWPGPQRRLDGVVVERDDGVAYSLELRERELSAEEQQLGARPWDWFVQRPGRASERCHPILGVAYTSFLRTAEWESVLDPERLSEWGLDAPRARLQIRPSEGEPVTLVVSGAVVDGRVAVLNGSTRCAFSVPGRIADLMAPEPSALLESATTNPWDEFLGR